ncbi:hypothetical protein V5799_018567, partial [Amblyomma americanum]
MDPNFMNLSLNSDWRSQHWPPVGDLTVMDLLEMIRNQSPGKIPLPGVSGRVSGYDYANTTAWKLNVTQVGRHDAKGFKRYCFRGRKDTVEARYTLSTVLSTLWWKLGARHGSDGNA